MTDPRRNQVDPFSDLHAVHARGLFTGNRGRLLNEDRQIVRHHQGRPWITCLLRFKDHHHPLDDPHRWTPLFFLDEAVALAAGHRPCAYCRRDDFNAYREAVVAGGGSDVVPRATDLDRMLASERLRRGRGLDRRRDRITRPARVADLPVGSVVVIDDLANLVSDAGLRGFGFDGWGLPAPVPDGLVDILTPPTSLAALRGGYTPLIHSSAEDPPFEVATR